MIQTVNFSQFSDSFGESYKDNFSYEGKRALFDYLEELEESTDQPIELDPVALCVEFTEYKNLEEIQSQYDGIKSLEDLESNTLVIPVEGTDRLIIQDY